MNFDTGKIQCQALKKDKKRCSRIATVCDGNKSLCNEHAQIARRDRANGAPIKKEKK